MKNEELIVFLVFVFGSVKTSIIDRKLNVSVYYDTLCPESIDFIGNQLIPSMINKNHLEHANLNLVPYGKVERQVNPFTKIIELKCQHGPRECFLNALHACIIENVDKKDALLLINCLLNEDKEMLKCATHHNINVDSVTYCTTDRQTIDILEKYGEMTAAINITFVPAIQMGNNFDSMMQYHYRTMFDTIFCREYKRVFERTIDFC